MRTIVVSLSAPEYTVYSRLTIFCFETEHLSSMIRQGSVSVKCQHWLVLWLTSVCDWTANLPHMVGYRHWSQHGTRANFTAWLVSLVAKTIFVFGTGPVPVPMPTEKTDGKCSLDSKDRTVCVPAWNLYHRNWTVPQTFFDTGPVPTEKTLSLGGYAQQQPAASKRFRRIFWARDLCLLKRP